VELLTRDIVPLIDPLQRSFHKFLMLLVHRAHASAYFVVTRRGKAPLLPPPQHGRRAICRRSQQ
jgi:hypothetical protein